MKKNVSMAATALEDFWEADKSLVALGEWCKINTTKTFTDTIPYVWDCALMKAEAIGYTHSIYEYLMDELVVILNNYHKVNETKLYWELIVGNWLIVFIQGLYSRYLTLKKFISLYPNFSTLMLDSDSYITPMEASDFTLKLVESDIYNLQLFSQILKFLNYSFSVKKYHNQQNLIFQNKKPSTKKYIFYKLLNIFSFNPNITISNPYFDNALGSCLKLFFKSRGKIVYDDFDDDFRFKFNINKRDRGVIFKKIKSNSEFVSLICDLLEVNFPILFLEGYWPFNKFIMTLKKRNSKLFATANSLHDNYIYKFYIAKKQKDIKTVAIQHGGNYGIDKIVSLEYYEKNISDYFFTFGWGNGKNEKNCSHEKINIKFKPKKDGDIVMISTCYPIYDFRIEVFCSGEYIKTDYIPKIKAFLSNIVNLDLFLYRPYPKDYGFDIVGKIKNKFPSLKVEKDRLKLKDRLKKSRLLVSDHFGTSVLETLAQNYPTVIFIEKKHYMFRRPEVIALLEDAKILFYDEVAAAKHVNEICGNIDSWWLSNKVQRAQKEFCFVYARTSNNWAKDWIREFSYILEDNAAINS